MHPATLAARSIGVMQQAVLAACIIYKYLHASEQLFVYRPKQKHAVKSMAYASRGISNAQIFNDTDFWLGA